MIELYVTGFGRPDLLREQHRLLKKYLADPFVLIVVDNTPERGDAARMEETCGNLGVGYVRVVTSKHEHHSALAVAFDLSGADYWGCLDHDVMPCRPVTLIDKIDQAGFFGLGQTYTPRRGQPLRYLFPGWIFFSQRWLNGRVPNFAGIRGEFRFDDGDTGSELHVLFDETDWLYLASVEHGYGTIREDDGHGLQSFGYEHMDGWVHLTNASHWKDVPDSDSRDQLLRDMLAAL